MTFGSILTMLSGYIIICIFIGAFLGASIFQWDTYTADAGYVHIYPLLYAILLYLLDHLGVPRRAILAVIEHEGICSSD